MQNEGKKFEEQFRKSVIDDNFYFTRLNDPAASFHSNDSLRFSPQNPYDCFIFAYPNFIPLELKSTQGSITFYRDDFENDGSKHTYMVKKHQILSLQKANEHKGIISGFILNFRKTNHTYFLHISDFTNMIGNLDKKSFNESDVIDNKGLLIEQSLKRVKYKYDIKKFVEELRLTYIQNNVG